MAPPTIIYRSGGAAVIPALASVARELHLREKLRVDTTFLPVKAVYFLLCAGSVCLVPFLSVYLAYIGLNSVQIGIAIGVQPFVQCVASPLCGSLADKYSMHRFLLVSSLMATGLVYGSGVFLPFLNADMKVPWTNLSSNDSSTFKHLGINRRLLPLDFKNIERECGENDKVDCFVRALHDACMCDSNSHSGIPYNSLSLNCESLPYIEIVTVRDCSIVKKNICMCIPYLLNESRLHTALTSVNFTTLNHMCERKCRASIREPIQISPTENGMNRNDALMSVGDGRISTNFGFRNQNQAGVKEGSDESLVFPFAIMYSIVVQCASSSFPILDGTALALIEECKKRGHHAEYGRQRLWGAVAWGIFAPLSGLAVDVYSSTHKDSFNRYFPAFILCTSAYLVAALSALLIQTTPRQPPESLSKDLRVLLLKPHILLFFLVLFISGISIGLINTYLFLFLQQLSGSHTLMGLTKTLTCASEVPFMFFAAWLIKKLSERGVFSLALLCFSLRFSGYALLSNPWLVLPIELLHGITQGALWPACASYVLVVTPERMVTTMQTLVYGTRFGLGQGVGILLGGVLFHHFGARSLFWGMAVTSLVILCFYLPASTYFEKREAARTLQSQYEEV